MRKPLWGALERPGLDIQGPNLAPDALEQLRQRLVAAVGAHRVWSDAEKLLAYSYDATGERHLPDLVVFVDRPEEIGTVVQVLGAAGMPIIGRGAGTNLSGGTMPIAGGAVLALARLNRVREVDVENLRAVVEPGVVNADFQEVLAPYHLFFAPDPGSHRISTLGGNVSENAGGPHCVKYGVTTNHVLGGLCYLVDGKPRRLPTTRDWRGSLDVTGLLTGSEGTLGLLAELELQVLPKPPRVETLLAAFDDLDRATEAVSAIIRARIVPSTLELLDRVSIETVERFAHAGYPKDAEAVLLIEVDGSPEAAEEERRRVEALLAEVGAISVARATTPTEVERLWKGRRSAYGAAAQVSSHIWVQDVTVPRPLLPAMMREVNQIGRRYGLTILIIAHAGDGNLHPNITYDPADPDEVARMHAADREIIEACVRMGGSITGEHGVGIDKLEHLALMYGPDELAVMWEIKAAWDPQNLLNPFKAVLPPERHHRARARTEPSRAAREVAERIEAALVSSKPVSVHGSEARRLLAPPPAEDAPFGIRTGHWDAIVEVDEGNLTVTVEPGVTARELVEVLAARGLEVPSLPHLARTVGGLVASNARHWGYRGLGWRDHVVMAEWVDGRGRVVRFGRKTMKNVAGYDVTKLMIGSWGMLGVLTELTLRLRPKPVARRVGRISGAPASDLFTITDGLRRSPMPPAGMLLHLEGTSGTLYVQVEGADWEAAQRRVEALAAERGLLVGWEDEALGHQLDEVHEAAVRRALAEGSYWEGGGLPANLRQYWSEGLGDEAWLFPFSGAIEVTRGTPAGAAWWVRRRIAEAPEWRRDPDWIEPEDRLFRVFDPHRLLPKPPAPDGLDSSR
ncbi:MAG: FAD-binding oxidoreductase [Firmicutes bacterium]|nr:FAD-binding protein [Alicyclobacillaceae bacterium]MCL6498204.1 FAD-binding oxidoreductase [Bacillota bacterium]